MRVDPRDPEQLAAYKAVIFSRMKLQGGPGSWLDYMEGVTGDGDRPAHPGQLQLHFDDPLRPGMRIVVPAAQRSGKSVSAAAELVAGLGVKGSQFWNCAPTFQLCEKVYEYVWEWVVNQKVHGDIVERATNSSDDAEIKLRFGGKEGDRFSWVRCRSTDPARGYRQLVGDQLDGVVWDECGDQPEVVWKRYLQPRLVNRGGWALFISEPKDFNWFWRYSEFWQKEEFYKTGWRRIHFSMADNPFIDPEEIEKLRLTLSGDEFGRVALGQFRSMAGLVWDGYRDELFPAGHLYDPAAASGELPHGYVPHSGTCVPSVDTGIDHPTACVWGSIDRYGDLYIYRDYEEQQPTHEDHAQSLKALTAEPIQYWLGGHDMGRKSSLRRGERINSPMKIYRQNGIPVRVTGGDPASVNASVSETGSYFAATMQANIDHPKIFISKDCVKLREAILRYTWDRSGIKEDEPTERPTKVRDDLCEALYRLCGHRPRYVSPGRVRPTARPRLSDLARPSEAPRRRGLRGRASAMRP